MKISTKGRYALRVMIELAIHYGDKYISLSDIAKRQNISIKYLEAIIALLNKAGLVESSRGKAGGYRLSKKPGECVVSDILVAAEGSLAPISCLEGKENKCPRAELCLTLPMWQGLEKVIYDYLSDFTVEDLIGQEFNI